MKNLLKYLASMAFFMISNSCHLSAQVATGTADLADYVANWTGTGSDGNAYLLTLNTDNTALLKSGSSTFDVYAWKLNFDSEGKIVYDKDNHTAMRLISNINNASSSTGQLTLEANTISIFKTYNTDVFYDTNANTLTMVVDLIGTSSGSTTPVTIVFTK